MITKGSLIQLEGRVDGKYTVLQDALILFALNLFAQNLFALNLFAQNQVMAQMQRASYGTGVWWKNS